MKPEIVVSSGKTDLIDPKSFLELLEHADQTIKQTTLFEMFKDKKKVAEIKKRLGRYLYLISKPDHIDEFDLRQEIATVIRNEPNMDPVENPWLAPFRLQGRLVACRQQLLDKINDPKESDDYKEIARNQIEKIELALKNYETLFQSHGLQFLKNQADLLEFWLEQKSVKKSYQKPHIKNKGLALMVEGVAAPVRFEHSKDNWHFFKVWIEKYRNKTPKYEHAVQQRQVHEHRKTVKHELARCLAELSVLLTEKVTPALQAFGNKSSKKLTKHLRHTEQRILKEIEARPIERNKSGAILVLNEISEASKLSDLLEIRSKFEHRHRLLMPWQHSMHRLEKAVDETNRQFKQLGKLGLAWNHGRKKQKNIDGIKQYTKQVRDVGNLSNMFDDLYVDVRSTRYGKLSQGNLEGMAAIRSQLKDLQRIEEAFVEREGQLKELLHLEKESLAQQKAEILAATDIEPTDEHVLLFHPRLSSQGLFKHMQTQTSAQDDDPTSEASEEGALTSQC